MAKLDGSLWERCYAGYQPLGDVSRDVLQLGLMCGPATGMRLLEPTTLLGEGAAPAPAGSVAAEGATQADSGVTKRAFEGKAGECFRVIAAFEDADVGQVRTTLEASVGAIGAGESAWLVSGRKLASVTPAKMALCLSAPGEVRLTLEANQRGRYAYQVWRRR